MKKTTNGGARALISRDGLSGVTRGARLAGAMAAAALSLAALPAHATDGSPAAPAAKWTPWAELGGYWSSDEASRGEVAVWAPLMQGSSALFFTDIRGKLFEEDVSEGNFAVGYRQMLTSGWNLGIWSGLDVRSTEADNTFWQLSGGLEALSANWDLRVNGYVPLTDPKGSPTLAEVQLAGNQIFMIGGQEVPLYGIDGEVGYRLLGTPLAASGRRHELRVYGGGFWFDASDALQEVAGPKARAEWRIDDVVEAWPGSRLTIEGEYSHDEVRDGRWEVGARLRIPFGSGAEARHAAVSLTPQERRMAEGLERDTDIVTVQSKEEPVEDALTNVDFDRVAQVGDGDSITDTSNASGDNTLIIATGTINGAQDLQGNQTLQGGGSTIQVRGLKSGTVAGFTAPGSRPTLANPGNADNLELLASNTHIAGLSIEGAGPGNNGNNGIFGDNGLNNMFIDEVSISDTGGNGIRLLGDNNAVSIANTIITDTGSGGILFGSNSIVDIADSTILGTGFRGIEFNNFNTVTITGTRVANTALDGIRPGTNNTVAIAGVAISNAGGNGIDFFTNNVVAISATSITGTGDNGIRFDNDNTVSIIDTSITNAGSGGILFGSNSLVDIVNTTISGTGFRGIEFNNFNTVTIIGTTVADTALDGIRPGNTNNVTLENSTLAGSIGLDGILIAAAGNTLSGAGNVASGATFGGVFCNAVGGQIGQFVFDIGTCP